MIRDRLVCGITDDNTQRLLLAEKELTYEKALEIPRSQEAAAQNVQTEVQTLRGMRAPFRGGPPITQGPPMEPVNAVKSGKQPPRQSSTNDVKSKDSSGACYRCGNTGHKLAHCKFLKAKGTPLKVLGLMNGEVSYEQQTITLLLLVVARIGASLLGHNWLEKITLNWKAIHTVNIDKLQEVLN